MTAVPNRFLLVREAQSLRYCLSEAEFVFVLLRHLFNVLLPELSIALLFVKSSFLGKFPYLIACQIPKLLLGINTLNSLFLGHLMWHKHRSGLPQIKKLLMYFLAIVVMIS